MSLELVAQRLSATPHGAGYRAHCPAHDDRNPSLSVSEGSDGRVVLHCHAGCPVERVLAAAGLEWSDLHPPNLSSAVVAEYLYTDHEGKPVAKKARRPRKVFSWYRETGTGWTTGLKRIEVPLYNLPQVLRAATKGGRVYLVEGEKDADNLIAIGLTATTTPHGAAGNKKWQPDWSTSLRGADVVIIPDNDDEGHSHAERAAREVHSVALSVKVLQLDNLEVGQDVSDWLEAGRTPTDLESLAASTPAWTPAARAPKRALRTRPLSQVSLSAVRWLWKGRIPEGTLSLVVGAPKVGKSTVMADLVARLTTGRALHGDDSQQQPKPPAKVAVLALEDSESLVRARVEAAGGDAENVFVVDIDDRRGQDLVSALKDILVRDRPALVWIDNVNDLMPAGKDSSKDMDVRKVLTPIRELAEGAGVAIVACHHLRKGGGRNASEVVLGSVAYVAVARSILMVLEDPDEPGKDSRLLAHIAVSGARKQRSLAFQLVQHSISDDDGTQLEVARVEWTGTDERSADDLVREQDEARNPPASSTSAVTVALRAALKSGPRESRAVLAELAALGFSASAVRRAAKGLRVTSRQNGFGNENHATWSLPPDSGQPSLKTGWETTST